MKTYHISKRLWHELMQAHREHAICAAQSQKAFETIERLRKPFTTIDTDDYRALYREEMERKYSTPLQ